jgi:hypothetical protein
MRIRTMGDELAGRRIVVMPSTRSDGLRGSAHGIALKNEALALREAIVGALDVLHLFDDGGRVVLIAKGELQAVNAEYLRMILESLFVTKHVVRKGLKYEVEFRPIQAGELAVRSLLTKDPKDGGLAGLLPVLNVETQGFAAPVAAAEKEITSSPLPEVQAEILAGRRTAARYADAGARTELEKARGAEMVRNYQGQRAAAVAPPIEESIPVFAPAEANDGAADPAGPPQS